MITIVSRTISAVVDQRLVLANGQAGRALTIGNTWNKVKIGLRLSLNGSASIVGNPVMAYGLCHGTSAMYGDATPLKFLGVKNTSSTWTYSAAAFNYWDERNWSWVSVVSGSVSTTTALASGNFTPIADIAYRSCMFIQIERGSPNFTLKLAFPQGAPSADISLAQFQSEMAGNRFDGSTGGFTINGQNYTYFAGAALAYDDSTDTLDTFNIYWSRSDVPMEISDVAIARMA